MRRINKILFMVIILLMCGTTLSLATIAAIIPEKSDEVKRWEALPQEERDKIFMPRYYNATLKDSVKRSTYNSLLRVGTGELDAKYSLKDKLSLVRVKNQQFSGTCWAFTFSSVLETTITKETGKVAKEYSPAHIEYVATQMYNRKLNSGGFFEFSKSYATSGKGPTYETNMPFEEVYDEKKYLEADGYLKPLQSVGNLDKPVNGRLENTIIFPFIGKYIDNGEIKYFNEQNIYNDSEVKAARNMIKTHIVEYGAISADIAFEGEHYNEETYAFYTDGSDINHAITIVGWDDNFAVSNFKAGKRPLNKGAYIALNSWGTEFGNAGYFYISYDDFCVEKYMRGIKSYKEGIQTEKIYQYDELGANYEIGFDATEAFVANVFSKNSAKDEWITGVGIDMLSTEGVEIYINSEDGSLTKGELVAVPGALESGYHYIQLAEPKKVNGNKFVIKIKYINNESFVSIPFESNLFDCDFSGVSTYYDKAKSNANESYISFDGDYWEDVDGYELFFEGVISKLYTMRNTNVCVKAFTTEQEPIIPVTGVQLNKNAVTLAEGTTEQLVATVKPEGANNKNVNWTSSNSSVATVLGGVVTAVKEGTTTITVTTVDGNYVASCNITVIMGVVVPVTSIKLNKTTMEVQEGDKTNLEVIISPPNASNKNIKWISSNPSIATVDDNGIITAIKTGIVTIEARSEDGNRVASCTVSVVVKTNTDDDIYKSNLEGEKRSEDETTSKKILPNAGKNIVVKVLIVTVLVMGTILFVKYKVYKKII